MSHRIDARGESIDYPRGGRSQHIHLDRAGMEKRGATNQRWLINHVVGGWSQWRQSTAVPPQKERNVSLDSRQRRATRQSGRQYQSRGGLGTNGVRAERRMGKWSVFLGSVLPLT